MPDSKYKARVIAINQHGKSRYSKFVEFKTLSEFKLIDVREYSMSEQIAKIKVTRRSAKDALSVQWQAVGLSDVSFYFDGNSVTRNVFLTNIFDVSFILFFL